MERRWTYSSPPSLGSSMQKFNKLQQLGQLLDLPITRACKASCVYLDCVTRLRFLGNRVPKSAFVPPKHARPKARSMAVTVDACPPFFKDPTSVLNTLLIKY